MKRVFVSTQLSKLNGICPDVYDALAILEDYKICYWDQEAEQARPLEDLPKGFEPSLFFIQDSIKSKLPLSIVSLEPSPDDYYLEHQSKEQEMIRKQFIPLNCKQASHESGSVYEKVTEILLDNNKKDKADEIIKEVWPLGEQLAIEGLGLAIHYKLVKPASRTCPRSFDAGEMKKAYFDLLNVGSEPNTAAYTQRHNVLLNAFCRYYYVEHSSKKQELGL